MRVETVKHACVMATLVLGIAGMAWADGGADCASAPTINVPADLPYADAGTTCGKGDTYDDPCSTSYGGGEDALYVLNVTAAGDYQISLTGTETWTGFFVSDGCPDTAPTCTGSATSSSGNPSAIITFPAAGTYYLMIDTWPSPDCTAYNLAISSPPAPPANDECAFATPIAVNSFVDTIDTVAATTDESPTSACGTSHFHNVWYTFTAVADGTATIDTCTSSYDTVLRVFTGGCGTLTEVACNDDSCGLQSEVSVAITAGTQYWVEVAAYSEEDTQVLRKDVLAKGERAGGSLVFTFDGGGAVPVELQSLDLD